MSAKVSQISTKIPTKSVIESLEDALESAKAGETVEIVMISRAVGGSVTQCAAGHEGEYLKMCGALFDLSLWYRENFGDFE